MIRIMIGIMVRTSDFRPSESSLTVRQPKH